MIFLKKKDKNLRKLKGRELKLIEMIRTLIFIHFLIAFSSCSSPSTEGDDGLITGGDTNMGTISKIDGIYLLEPLVSPGADPTPLINITGVASGDTVSVFSDITCSTLVTSEMATGETVEVSIPTLTIGTHRFYAKRTKESESRSSDCSTLFLDYTLEGISITGVEDDLTAAMSKTFTWGCAGTASCEYRFAVNTSETFEFSTESFDATTTTTYSSGSGDFYIHLQARDSSDNTIESGVYSYQFVLDNTSPVVTANTIAAGTYGVTDMVEVSVNFDENILVTGSPRIQLNFETESASPTYAVYASGSGSQTLVFQYTVALGDEDTNNISSQASIDVNDGTLTDELGNELNYTLATTSYSDAFVDGISPSIISITVPANTYFFGRNATYYCELLRSGCGYW